ncbi:MAG: WD40 repeat domain-containing protein [Bacteroidetes bacterium]|nr:WD40 repeat domain-containing protein [Bacteroidota bacterium]
MRNVILLVILSSFIGLSAQDSTYSFKMKFTGHTRALEAVAFSPDGQWLASGGWDNELHIYRADTPGLGNLKFNLKGHMSAITCVAYSKDGSLVASGSKDNTIRVYNTSDGSLLYSSLEHTGAITKLIFDPTGKYLMSSSKDGTIRMFNLYEVTVKTNVVPYGKPINSFAVASNGKSLYVATAKGDIDNIGFKGQIIKSLTGHGQQVNCLELSPNGKLLVSGADDKTVIVWDLVAGTALKTLTGHGWKVTSVNWSTDGKYVVSTCNDGATIVWDVESGKALSTLQEMGSNARCASFSPDLARISVATVLETQNHGAIVYNTPLKKMENKPVVKEKKPIATPAKNGKPGPPKRPGN